MHPKTKKQREGAANAKEPKRKKENQKTTQAKCNRLAGDDRFDELAVVDGAILVGLDSADELVDLAVGQLLAQAGQHVAELASGDLAVAIAVKDGEALDELLLGAVCLPALRTVLDLQVLGKADGLLAWAITTTSVRVSSKRRARLRLFVLYLRGRAR